MRCFVVYVCVVDYGGCFGIYGCFYYGFNSVVLVGGFYLYLLVG